MSGSKPVLEARVLVKAYSGRTVVAGVSVLVSGGEVVGLLGPNGAGKTTTFSIVVGLVAPDAGSVLLDGEDITTLPMYRRAVLGLRRPRPSPRRMCAARLRHTRRRGSTR